MKERMPWGSGVRMPELLNGKSVKKDYPVNCVNCGKQNLIEDGDPYDVKCEFGDHPARIKVQKEAENMAAQINAKELYPETRRKLGIDAPSTLSPLPPRPALAGDKHGRIGGIMNKYYEANAPAILADRDVVGDREARRRWGFSECGYKNFLKRRGLVYEGCGRGRKKSSAPAAAKIKKEAEEVLKTAAAAIKPKSEGEPERIIIFTCDICGVHADNVEKLIEHIKLHRLPPLPLFKWYWLPGVQKKWLQIYRELAGK